MTSIRTVFADILRFKDGLVDEPRWLYVPLTILFLVAAIFATVTERANNFLILPDWILIITIFYMVAMIGSLPLEGALGCISKVYAPFVIFVYWLAIYPTHDPWKSKNETFVVVVTYMMAPIFSIVQTFRKLPTPNPMYRTRNAKFPLYYSFSYNTAVYLVYMLVYLSVLPSKKDPIYTGIGFTLNEDQDFLILFIGWLVVMGINILIVVITWWWRKREHEFQVLLNEEEMSEMRA